MTREQEIHKFAVFDLDGTVLDGHSPVMLVETLFFSHAMPVRTGIAVAWWGLRYKMRLPHDQEAVRKRIFSLFAGRPTDEVDHMLEHFYDDVVSKHVRNDARREIEAYQHDGIPVVLVSASFEAIVKRAANDLGAYAQISTQMEEANGTYTGKVSGRSVQGVGKRDAFSEWADSACGVGNWEIVAAYGDHYTDEQIMLMARYPVAINPDNKLKRIASEHGWEIREWH